MDALALDRRMLAGVTDTVAAKVRGANYDDAEEAVQTALLEWLAKGEALDLDLSRPVAGALVTRAVWRLKTARSKREAGNASLDAFLEGDEDSAPVEVAVVEDDLDSHLAIGEARQDSIVEERFRIVEAGADPRITPRGSYHAGVKYSAERVAEARRLRSEEGLSYAAIADVIGCSQGTVERWVKGQGRVIDTPGWSAERILDALRRFAESHGRPPRFVELNGDPKLPGYTVVVKRFGSFNKALEVAGLPTRPKSLHSRENLDRAFLDFEREHGRWPKSHELLAANGFSGVVPLTRVYGTASVPKIRAQIEAGDARPSCSRAKGN